MLRKDGTLFISIVHPLADLELLAVSGPGAPSETPATYFDRRRFETKVESRGLTMHFAGWAQPLEGYVSVLESSGFAITSLREPTADQDKGGSFDTLEQVSLVSMVKSSTALRGDNQGFFRIFGAGSW